MTVLQQQCLLGYLGHLGAGKMDGIPGAITTFSVKEFQRTYGLTEDGICGPITEQMLLDVVSGKVARKEPAAQTNTTVQAAVKVSSGDWWDEIEYFSRNEENIHCPCPRCTGKSIDPEKRLMQEADHIRKAVKKAMIPSSVRRCQAHNDELDGSAPNSYHVRGLAMDFDIPALADSEIIKILEAEKAAGRVRYWYQMSSGWFHFDVN